MSTKRALLGVSSASIATVLIAVILVNAVSMAQTGETGTPTNDNLYVFDEVHLNDTSDVMYTIANLMFIDDFAYTPSGDDSYNFVSIVHRLMIGYKYIIDTEKYGILTAFNDTSLTFNTKTRVGHVITWNPHETRWENELRDRLVVSDQSASKLAIFYTVYWEEITGYTQVPNSDGTFSYYYKAPISDDIVKEIHPDGVFLPNGTRIVLEFTTMYKGVFSVTGTGFLFHYNDGWYMRGTAINIETDKEMIREWILQRAN